MKKKMNSANTADMKIAGGLTADDKQILRDHAAMLRKLGTPSALRELEQMNIRYRNHGLTFPIKGA